VFLGVFFFNLQNVREYCANILWDKIARPHESLSGYFIYSKNVFPHFFIHKILHPYYGFRRTLNTSNEQKISSPILEEFCNAEFYVCRVLWMNKNGITFFLIDKIARKAFVWAGIGAKTKMFGIKKYPHEIWLIS